MMTMIGCHATPNATRVSCRSGRCQKWPFGVRGAVQQLLRKRARAMGKKRRRDEEEAEAEGKGNSAQWSK